MPKQKDTINYFECGCSSEILRIEHVENDKFFELTFWKMARSPKIMTWKERIRWCWYILRNGTPFNDFFILSYDNAKALSKFLTTKSKEKSNV